MTLLGALIVVSIIAVLIVVWVLTRPSIAKAHGMADFLPYARLVGANRDAMRMRDGGFMALFEISAEDRETFSDAELGVATDNIARAIGALDAKFVVHFRDRRRVVTSYPRPPSYPNPMFAWLDDEAESRFLAGNKFTTQRIMSVRMMGSKPTAEKWWTVFASIVERLFGRAGAVDEKTRAQMDQELFEFEAALKPALNLLRGKARVRRLGIIREMRDGIEIERSELLEELSFAISGRRRKIKVPRTLLSVASLLSEPMRGGAEPRIGGDEIAIVVAKDLPGATQPTWLHDLAQLAVDYDLVVRWLPLSRQKSAAMISKASAEWERTMSMTKSLHAGTMMAGTQSAQKMLDEGHRFGMVSITVVLRAKTRAEVDRAASRCVAILDELYVPAFVATSTVEDDFFGGLFGIGHGQNRRYQVHSMNLMDLFSVHAPSAGRTEWPAKFIPRSTPPLMMAAAGKAFNAYGYIPQASSPDDVFHLLGWGGTGSGKTTAIAYTGLSFLSRVPNSGWTAIDTGRSLYRPALWFDAPFFDLLGQNAPGINMFADLEDAEAMAVVGSWLNMIVAFRNVPVTGKRGEALTEALELLRASIPPEERSLTAYLDFLQDPEGVLKPALRQLSRRFFGRTLDSEGDRFELSQLGVIDLGRAWSMEPALLVPLLSAVFWKIRRSILRRKAAQGNFDAPWLITMDEAHKPMRTELGLRFTIESLKEGRRDRIGMHLWSNAAVEFATSAALNDLKEQIPTRMAAGTSSLVGDDEETKKVRGFVAALGFPPHGIDQLPKLNPKSWLLVQPEDKELQELSWDLGPAQLTVFGATSKEDNRRLDTYRARYPDTWRYELLRADGVPETSIRRFMARMEEWTASRAAAAELTAAS